MADSSPTPAAEIPDSFFTDLAPSGRPSEGRELIATLGHPVQPGTWQPQKILPWYDAIIDDMFANPGCTMRETAARLVRSPVTIGLIVRSDLFKSRYEQRRASYNLEIQHRLTGKLVQVAEAALDHTLTALEKKRDAVPLPVLREITTDALDRLGYGSSSKPGAPATITNVSVGVQTGPAGQQVVVSASALEEARAKLRAVEATNTGGVIIDSSCEVLEEDAAPLQSKPGGGLDAL